MSNSGTGKYAFSPMTELKETLDFSDARTPMQALTDQKTINSLNLFAELLAETRWQRDEAVRERDALQARMDAARAVLESA
jgi:hypothetical protein